MRKAATISGAGAAHPRPRTRSRRVSAGLSAAVALTALLLLSAAVSPGTAFAQGGIGQEDPLTEWFVGTFNRFFGGGGVSGRDSALTAPVYWLVSVPNYAVRGEHIMELEGYTSAIALALLAAVVTLAIVGHWAAGFTGQGSDLLSGLTRSIGAGLFILAWPWIFGSGVALVNGASHALIGESTLEIGRLLVSVAELHDRLGTTGVLAGALAIAAPVAAVVMGLVAIAMWLLWLLLALSKIGFNAGLVLVFVATPMSAALWPLPGFAWIAQWGLKAGTALALIPLGWALLMAAAVAVGVDNLLADPVGVTNGAPSAAESEGAGAAALNTLGGPLVALALIVTMLKLPGMILRTAGVSSDGRGFVSGMLSYTASQFAFGALSRHIPAALGGTRAPSGQPALDPSSVGTAPPQTTARPAPTSGPKADAAATAAAAAPTSAAASAPGSARATASPATSAGAATGTSSRPARPGAPGQAPARGPATGSAAAGRPASAAPPASAPTSGSTPPATTHAAASAPAPPQHDAGQPSVADATGAPPPSGSGLELHGPPEGGLGGFESAPGSAAAHGGASFDGDAASLRAPSPEELVEPGRMPTQGGDSRPSPDDGSEA